MASKKIKDLSLLTSVDGTEKIPTGGKGDYSISVNQVVEKTLEKTTTRDFTHKESKVSFNDDRNSSLTLDLGKTYSHRFYNDSLTEIKDYITNITLKADNNGIYNIILDIESLFTPQFTFENNFFFEPNIPNFDINKQYPIFLVTYTKLDNWEQVTIGLRIGTRKGNPFPNGGETTCDNPQELYSTSGDSDRMTISMLKFKINGEFIDTRDNSVLKVTQVQDSSSGTTSGYVIKVYNMTDTNQLVEVYFGDTLSETVCLKPTPSSENNNNPYVSYNYLPIRGLS